VIPRRLQTTGISKRPIALPAASTSAKLSVPATSFAGGSRDASPIQFLSYAAQGLYTSFLNILDCRSEVGREPAGAQRTDLVLVRVSHTYSSFLETFHHAANLSRVPYPAAGRRWNAALVERHCDSVPRRYSATSYLRNDRSQLSRSRVGTRNRYLAPGFAGLGLPSLFHGFQGRGKTRTKGLSRRG
jgi:hypothetical protein